MHLPVMALALLMTAFVCRLVRVACDYFMLTAESTKFPDQDNARNLELLENIE